MVCVFKFIALAAALLAPLSLLSATSSAEEPLGVPVKHEVCVVLLHGLFRTGWSMKPLASKLSQAGFGVSYPTYRSLSYPIETLAVNAVEEGLTDCRAQNLERIHFVTHSLGGILVRQYMATKPIPGLERVVMLGPPNQGSQVADFVHAQALLRPFAPLALEQLGTGENSIPAQLGPATFDLGIIAGTTNNRAALPGFHDGPSDGTVAVAETVVPGMLDFLEMPVSHTFMMWNSLVAEQTIHFLRHGKFKRDTVVPER